VAVGLVLAQHVGERTFPAFAAFTHSSVLLGQMGVMVFFLCSGFIIPASLERGRAGDGRIRRLAAFWRSRFFRLFPLYWVSLAAVLWLTLSGSYGPPTPMSARDWVANISMAQMLIGFPNALTVYWTLAFELLFYGGLSALLLVGMHRRSVLLSLGASAVCLALALGAGSLVGATPPTGAFCLATMFTGTVFHRWQAGDIRLRWLLACVAAALISGTALLAAAVLGTQQPPQMPLFPAMLTAWLGAYAVFAVGFAMRSRRLPAWLLRLGTVSYSVYLMQGIVLVVIAPLADPVLTAVVWVVATVVLSEATYRLVERPSVRLGRRHARRGAETGTSQAPSPSSSARIRTVVSMSTAEALRRRAREAWHLVLTELSRFGVVGAVSFVVDIGLFQLLYTQTGVGAVMAKLVSTVVSTTVAYVGHRYWSFSHRARSGVRREYAVFTAINAVTLLLGLGVVYLARHPLGQDSALVLQVANVGSIALGTVIRYLAYRQWVFTAPRTAEAQGPVPAAALGDSRTAA
jgi:peptidoglycan/LPS O-acetylase OafA/YrhL/putative flippase GtrA